MDFAKYAIYYLRVKVFLQKLITPSTRMTGKYHRYYSNFSQG